MSNFQLMTYKVNFTLQNIGSRKGSEFLGSIEHNGVKKLKSFNRIFFRIK